MKLFRTSILPARGQGNAGARRGARAFTMIEIAISLAIIGFALAAIVGILPLGMSTQKQNREETIINQDNQVLMDAIRNGARGFDDLTNYIVAITNSVDTYNRAGTLSGSTAYWYTPTRSSTSAQFPLNTGLRIVGLLSTPTYVPLYDGSGVYQGYLSNRVNAYFRAMSGQAHEKFPQDNGDVRDLAFSYRLTTEVIPLRTNYWPYFGQNEPGNPGYPAAGPDTTFLTNYLAVAQANSRQVRLNFRWPLLARNAPGPGQQAFQTFVTGTLVETNELGFQRAAANTPSPYDLYFFEPATLKAP